MFINGPGWAAPNAAETQKALSSCSESVCAAAHKPMGDHRAHTTPTPHFTRGQENGQRSRAGTEMMEELENWTHCRLYLTDSCQMPAADGFRRTWISLLAGNPSLLLSTDTKSVWELNSRKAINKNQEMCYTPEWALQPYNTVSWSERNSKQETYKRIPKYLSWHAAVQRDKANPLHFCATWKMERPWEIFPKQWEGEIVEVDLLFTGVKSNLPREMSF